MSKRTPPAELAREFRAFKATAEHNPPATPAAIKVVTDRLAGQCKAVSDQLSGSIKAMTDKVAGQFKPITDQITGQLKAMAEQAAGPIKEVMEQVASDEAAARHWYRLLVGDSQPHWPIGPYPRSLRRLLEREYPNDPDRVEDEIAASQASLAQHMQLQCWGTNGEFLWDALAACGIKPQKKAKQLTYSEIAEVFKTAYERQRPGAADSMAKPPASQKRPPEQMDPLAMAIAFMSQRAKQTRKLPTLPEVLIAVPHARKSTLYRDPAFKASRRAIKESLCAHIPKGHKTDAGSVEASDE